MFLVKGASPHCAAVQPAVRVKRGTFKEQKRVFTSNQMEVRLFQIRLTSFAMHM